MVCMYHKNAFTQIEGPHGLNPVDQADDLLPIIISICTWKIGWDLGEMS